MYRIAVCDDERHFRELIKELILKYMGKLNLECEVELFHSGKELIGMGFKIVRFQVVFLDISMEGLNGIEAAQKIREISSEIYLVFVTAYFNYALEGYRVDAVRYLLKDNTNFENTMHECLDAIIEKMNYKIIKKHFSFVEGEKDLLLERILYIESRLHKLEFYVVGEKTKTYSLYDTLNKQEKILGEYGFVRIHQSYLVNLKYLYKVSGYRAVLNNGIELPIPKSRYKSVKNAFIAYKGEV
ncbi:two component transcriptional regulator, LytTR family [Anaerocolumna jejuensis DSM 15929]|uniref:Stage 0 sporulation protein A homolog n=1 Tax=Anaerocolumna jejuensis DSM 15929 TaxID=1121322 RepID=A0A1M6ZBF9_9FIRM|nr:LytTR family DNA-binding domain-containing protein [Anaerocolumna jejuensis]SHL27812.1 two component transcriptional regulator, LytTR family [Anaerocolumna jejuensis DSM 15929]